MPADTAKKQQELGFTAETIMGETEMKLKIWELDKK